MEAIAASACSRMESLGAGAAAGAVGSVLRTSHGYSDVMLLTDRLSAVDVLLPRTGARGILRGVGAEGRLLR